VFVIDLFGLSEDEVRASFPAVYQHVVHSVKPERDQNSRETYRRFWWIHGEPRREIRKALDGLRRFVCTVETSKHRFFQFLDADVAPDNMLITIATEDALHLGVLSSRIHVVWALTAGGRLGVGNDPRYNKTACFDPFPFPAAQKQKIRELGDALDAHRKTQQAAHPGLTITGMYNVLEKLRSGEELTAKEKKIHDDGLVSVLKKIHDDLDAAVFDAYGWPATLSDDEILGRLVALNYERAAEEKRGLIRWLRPEFQNQLQNKTGGGDVQQTIGAVEDDDAADDGDEPGGQKPKRGRAAGKKSACEAAVAQGSRRADAGRAGDPRRGGRHRVGCRPSQAIQKREDPAGRRNPRHARRPRPRPPH
jgi:hypothetical protein